MMESKILGEAYRLSMGCGLLTAAEVEGAVQTVKRLRADKKLQFIEVNHVEPTKQEVMEAYTARRRLPRLVEVISMCLQTNETLIDIVDCSHVHSSHHAHSCSTANPKPYPVVESKALKDVQAGISPDEYALVEVMCKAYPPLLEAIAKRGLDPAHIVADAWCVGHTGSQDDPTERICWPSLYYQDPAVDHLPYTRPIEGIDVRISLTHRKIVHFEDNALGVFPIPGSYEAKSHYYPPSKWRKDLKPIVITQPQGPSFHIKMYEDQDEVFGGHLGHAGTAIGGAIHTDEVHVQCAALNSSHEPNPYASAPSAPIPSPHQNNVYWQKWNMNIGFNSREGVCIHNLTYEGRPVLHKMSMCEMVVPYGDPRSPHCLKNAFDAGEDGLGRNANSLVYGCDCLGHIKYFDANMVKDDGSVFTLKNAICMHEEDASICWKHTDWRTGVPAVARNRKLVVSFICTIANYEYGFYYYFFLDGNMEVEVKLTGVLSTGAYAYSEGGVRGGEIYGQAGGVADGLSMMSLDAGRGAAAEGGVMGGRKYGVPLGGSLYAPAHQHFFVARIHPAVDGVRNTVMEWEAHTETEGPHNLPRNGFYFTEQPLCTEKAGRRACMSDAGRFWVMKNTTTRNSIGQYVGYKLAPKGSIKPMAPLAIAPYLKRAQFLEYQLWVTRFERAERYPAGDFPNQAPHLDGLVKWVERDAPIENEDIVLWHSFGVTHCPRPEEWPVMPAETCGFRLLPFGFFDHNPAMDVPQSIACVLKEKDVEAAGDGECAKGTCNKSKL